MEEIDCPQCGQANPTGANFCSVCGVPLARDDHEKTETHEVLGVQSVDDLPMLIVVRGTNVGSKYALDSAVTSIGRHPDSDVFLDDVTVSRRHAELRRSGEEFTVADVGSLNGTYLNGHRVESADLTEGDQLQVGRFKLVFVLGGPGGGD